MERVTSIGVDLRRGPVTPLFEVSRLPDFRLLSDDDQYSPQNRARHELYLERLRMVGVNPSELERRILRGLRFKQDFRRPKFKVPEQVSVQA